jgi:hypothetical protein
MFFKLNELDLPWKKRYALSWLTVQTDVPPYPTEGPTLTAFIGEIITACGEQVKCQRGGSMNIGEGIRLVAVRSPHETRRKKPCTFLSQISHLTTI